MLDNLTLEQVIKDWSFEDKSPPPSIARTVLRGPTLQQWGPDLVLVIQGVRRCGKSTLLQQIMQVKKLNPQHCFFVNFEDPRLAGNLNYELLQQIVQYAEKKYKTGKALYFFFDEIQNVALWEKWLHTQVERPKKNYFVITGSNASLLSSDLATALTGRHITIELFPFNYGEFKLLFPEASVEEFFDRGGFPKALSIQSPETLLREYFVDIIERDVRRYIAVRSTTTLLQIAKAVMESTGSETSYRKLANINKSTADTIHNYVEAYVAAYLVLPCYFFSYSERKQAVRQVKYYPIDLGLYRAVVAKTGLNLGKKLETVVFHRLRREYQRVFYWRGKNEVDFVVHGENGITPYQVSWEGKKDRHQLALDEFYKEFPKANPAIFISKDNCEKILGRE